MKHEVPGSIRGSFPCRGRIPLVITVRVISISRLKAPPGTSLPNISPLIPSGQRNCASWASQPQKSVTLSPQPGGATKVRMNMWWHYERERERERETDRQTDRQTERGLKTSGC